MGVFNLFKPKLSQFQIQQINSLLKQAQESAHLVNTTVNPAVFFGRLNFLLDVLLELQKYEPYRVFRGSPPSKEYSDILNNLEKSVDAFVTRSFQKQQSQAISLKTEKAKRARYDKFVVELISAFDCAHTFWTGNQAFPHYTGPLFAKENYQRIQALFESKLET